MFPLKFLKIFLLVALFASACRFWQTQPNAEPTPTPIAVEELKSEIPFATKEPEIFQTEIFVTANGIENKMFTARNSADRVTIFNYQTPNEITLLQTGSNNYSIARNQKIYTENQTQNSDGDDETFPVAELLNQKETAVYEQISVENDLAKYRVTLDASKNSEIIVTVDEKINLPIKQEFFTVNGDQKTLTAVTELKNFSLQIDAQNFELPKDFKRVAATEFQEIIRRKQ